jgi:hypothetical protein
VNNKRSVYLLLPLVLLVWGLIGWRIWAAASDSATEAEQPPTMALHTKPILISHRPVLLLTYGDPFKPGSTPASTLSAAPRPVAIDLSNAPVSEKSGTKLNFTIHPIAPPVTAVMITWPQIKYMGVIAHSGSNAQVALLAIDNQELVIKAGKSERDIQVLKLFRDSVQLGFHGQKKSFVRNAAN